MKKAIALVSAALLALLLLAGCSSNNLPGDLDADTLKTRTRAIGDTLVARDYEAFIALFDADAVAAAGATMPSAEALADAYNPILDSLGNFVEYGTLEAGPLKDAAGTEYAVVLIDQKFANGTLSHTATFTPDGGLIGFIIRQ